MESYSLQNPSAKRVSAVKALLIEIGVIAILVIIMIFILGYFKIINLASFLPGQESQRASNVAQLANNIAITPKLSPKVNATASQQPISNSDIITKNKAWHYVTTTSEFEGKIAEVNMGDGVDSKTGTKYKVRLVFYVGKDDNKVYFPLSQQAVSKLKLLGHNEKKLTLLDFKPGNPIVFTMNIDPLRQYPNWYNEIILKKL